MTHDDLDACGCCEAPTTPDGVHNPPGLTELQYRIANHGEFLRRMLSRLPQQTVEDAQHTLHYPLDRLTTRSTDDPAIALLDAWAGVGDVLTFYQERIANEGFLRTATERRSILELARLIGYELNPGVAASAFLAFQVDTAVGAPRSVVVSKGSQIHSVPGQNEVPQTFETTTEITARLEWNNLQPRKMRPQQLAINGDKLYLLGAGEDVLDVTTTFSLDSDAAVAAGGTVTAAEVDAVYVAGTSTNLHAGDVMLLAGLHDNQTSALPRTVRAVQEEPALERTRVEFDVPVAAPLRHFGYVVAPALTATTAMKTLNASNVDALIVGQAWKESSLSAWLSVQGWSAAHTVDYIAAAYNRPAKAPLPGDPGVFAMRTKVGFFGHNAPAFTGLTDRAQAPFYNWDTAGGLSVWKNTQKALPADADPAPLYTDADCFLERSVNGIVGNSWAVFETPNKQLAPFRVATSAEVSLAGFSLSAKTTGLQLHRAADGEPLAPSDKLETFNVRKTTAHIVSDRLTLAQLPIDDAFGRGTQEETALTLDRMVLNLVAGQPIAITGERDDLPGVTVSEVVIITDVVHSGGFTTLQFESPGMMFKYVRATASLCANVVDATHGETVTEVLGSGSGGRANAGFVLRKPPLTYTASSDASGSDSSLEIRVDGVAWSEAPRLYGSQPDDEQYLVRRSDDGKATVIFGDGVQGARLPTGVENVVARYRSGIGRAGMVRPGSLTMLMTRPLGIRDVTNPLAASGAADPEQRDDARQNAPLTVLAIERVVSLQDAVDFSRAFAGIGKCTAKGLSRRGLPWIHLTVAAAAPAPDPGGLASAMADHRLAPSSALRRNLASALSAAKEPSARVRLDTYQPVFVNVVARVLIDQRYLWADVEARVIGALIDSFSFERRDFGRSVTVTEVVTIIQGVHGVVFVDLDALHRFDEPASLPPANVLVAGQVTWAETDAEPTALAELLLVNPLGVALTPVALESVQ